MFFVWHEHAIFFFKIFLFVMDLSIHDFRMAPLNYRTDVINTWPFPSLFYWHKFVYLENAIFRSDFVRKLFGTWGKSIVFRDGKISIELEKPWKLIGYIGSLNYTYHPNIQIINALFLGWVPWVTAFFRIMYLGWWRVKLSHKSFFMSSRLIVLYYCFSGFYVV
jgi:hypothetical protein